jgi:hypothetical protein
MTKDVLALPERAGSRAEAQSLLDNLSKDLDGTVLRFDGHHLGAGSSSFMDELVKEVLVERRADGLVLDGVTERSAAYAQSSAARRGVAGRLTSLPRH